MQTPLFLMHGVPDTPEVWAPLIKTLGTSRQTIVAPALPGFTAPTPRNFAATKDAYADWLLSKIKALHAEHGPIDIVGHDWGALLTLRAASLVPEYIRSWAVSGAVIHADYRGHRVAKLWATPLIGELIMALSNQDAIMKNLIENGLPSEIAAVEASHWSPSMRRCILRLYRSARALRFEGGWLADLHALPKPGLVLWGEQDPYVDISFAKSFAEQHGVPCHVDPTSGHWLIAQNPAFAATHLIKFWQSHS